MTLCFAYGSNMDRAAMQARCPAARAAGVARLDGHEFFIGADGWASVRRAGGRTVHGVLWRLTPRDLAALNAYEALHKGLYRLRTMPVRIGTRTVPALIYVLCRTGTGRPKPGYIAQCAAAARSWNLPDRHVRAMNRWMTRWPSSPAQP